MNKYVFFKRACACIPGIINAKYFTNNKHKIVIHADKSHAGEHVRRFNAPTTDELTIIMISDQF